MVKTDSDAVKSADRALDILEHLAVVRRPISHSEIAEHLQIPKSSLSKLLRNLLEREYLRSSPDGRGYWIGPGVDRLAALTAAKQDIASIATPVLEQITEQVAESSALNQLRDDVAEVVSTVAGPQRLSTHMRLGDVAPLYATSGGKIILAFMPAAWREDYLQRVPIEALTPNSVSLEVLREQLQVARDDAVAYSFDEYTIGITGIAKPILTAAGEPIASINVAIPTARFNEALKRHAIESLSRGARLIERMLQRDGAAAWPTSR